MHRHPGVDLASEYQFQTIVCSVTLGLECTWAQRLAVASPAKDVSLFACLVPCLAVQAMGRLLPFMEPWAVVHRSGSAITP